MPELRAASLLEPMAYTRRPHTVRYRRKATSATIASQMIASTGIPMNVA